MPRSVSFPPIERVTIIQASPARVWSALTQARHLKRWYTKPHKVEARKGGTWEFLNGTLSGQVLRIKPKIEFVHSYKLTPDEPETRVRFELKPLRLGGKSCTELTFVHDQLRSAKLTHQCCSDHGAWTWIFCNLKTYLETGAPITEGSFS